MNYEEAIELEALVREAQEKWAAYDAMRMQNMPFDFEKRVEVRVALEKAEIEWSRADARLRKFKMKLKESF